MNTVELQSPGLDGLVPVERPVPEPGPGEVLLRLRAASLNYRDLATITAQPSRAPLPVVPLSDGCGEIVATGAGVSRVSTGDRVAPSFFPRWISGRPTAAVKADALGSPLDGCLQRYLVLSEQSVSKAPAHLSDAEVASLPCAALTAWRALFVDGNVQPGDTVLVQGTGGVSIFALQFAKLIGARVIATSSSDEKLERVTSLGADATLNYRENPKWAKAVRDLAGGEGVDHVIDVGGAGSLAQSVACLATGGQVSVIGILGGFEEKLPIFTLMGNQATVKGIMVGSRQDFEQMARAMEQSQLKPIISDVFDFADHRKALELMQAGGHFGKICIAID